MEFKKLSAVVLLYSQKLRSFVTTTREKTTPLFKRMVPQTTLSQVREKGRSMIRKIAQRSRAMYERLVVHGAYTKKDFVTLFVIAVFLGIVFKMIAASTVTIGFEDYKLSAGKTAYDLNAIQKQRIAKGGVSVSNDVVNGGTCSE